MCIMEINILGQCGAGEYFSFYMKCVIQMYLFIIQFACNISNSFNIEMKT